MGRTAVIAHKNEAGFNEGEKISQPKIMPIKMRPGRFLLDFLQYRHFVRSGGINDRHAIALMQLVAQLCIIDSTPLLGRQRSGWLYQDVF